MNPLVAKYAPYAALLALAGGLLGGLILHEREVGRLQVELQQSKDSLAVLTKAKAVLVAQHVSDSTGAAKAAQAEALAVAHAHAVDAKFQALAPALTAARRSLDSAMQVAQQHPDSGSQGILIALRPYLAQADGSLNACKEDVSAQQDALQKCRAHGDSTAKVLLDLQGLYANANATIGQKDRQLQIASQKIPGAFSTWAWRIGAFAVGIFAGHIGK